MPFLRLTRDRRGFENTFLLHADHPGARPRLLYWYRTAPGIGLGRPALDEDAIRTIEEHHPDIEFDWPAILALSEVMTPEDEPSERPAFESGRKSRKSREPRRDDRADVSRRAVEGPDPSGEVEPDGESPEPAFAPPEPEQPRRDDRAQVSFGAAVEARGLVDDLAGREVARALRARYAEIKGKIDRLDVDRGPWLARLEAINPDAWLTPDAVLHGVSNAGAAYEKLKRELDAPEAGQG